MKSQPQQDTGKKAAVIHLIILLRNAAGTEYLLTTIDGVPNQTHIPARHCITTMKASNCQPTVYLEGSLSFNTFFALAVRFTAIQVPLVPFGERHVDVVQPLHVDLENLIAECMDRMYE